MTTLADLISDLQDYTTRADLTTDQWKRIVSKAEKSIMRQIRLPMMERTVLMSIDDLTPSITIPEDFLELKEIWEVGGAPLERISLPRYLNYEPYTARPTMFARNSGVFELFPNASAAIYITYYAEPSELNELTDTHNLLNVIPDIYLYASLSEACVFLQDWEKKPIYQAEYARTLAEINEQAHSAEYAGSTLQQSNGVF